MNASIETARSRSRSILVLVLGMGLLVLLGGCASNGVIDACPAVRYENPSLLQGRSSLPP